MTSGWRLTRSSCAVVRETIEPERKTDGRRGRRSAEGQHQPIISPAAADGLVVAAARIARLEDEACVVIEIAAERGAERQARRIDAARRDEFRCAPKSLECGAEVETSSRARLVAL